MPSHDGADSCEGAPVWPYKKVEKALVGYIKVEHNMTQTCFYLPSIPHNLQSGEDGPFKMHLMPHLALSSIFKPNVYLYLDLEYLDLTGADDEFL